MTATTAVAVVGAGPYGLSLAAHFAANGVDAMVFGPPMRSWAEGMPSGMHLKSEGFASSLSDPDGAFTLAAFCAAEGLAYTDLDTPVPVETFTAYGRAFQRTFVPKLDPRFVRRLARSHDGFSLELDDGTCVRARRVIVATGISPYRHIPDVLASLPPARLSHTSERADYTPFRGRRVMVVGAGASAVDAAAALHRAGAVVSLVTRRPSIRFHAGRARGWIDRILSPMTPLGPGWRKLACVKAPLLFHALPERLRVALVRRYLGPAPGWSARDDFEGKVAVRLGARLSAARETDDGIELEIVGPDGRVAVERVDHVVAGTGYKVDLRALPFLDAALARTIASTDGAPRLSRDFETSISGLYFVGTPAAFAFGPMLRFVCGAGFAARRVAAHVKAAETVRSRRSPIPAEVGALAMVDYGGRPLP